jgi:peptide/nickel transport system substrate-binding protein
VRAVPSVSSTHIRFLVAACILNAWTLCGCRFVRGDSKKSGAAPGATQAGRPTGNSWIDGKLPASVVQGQPREGGELVFQIDANPPSLNPIVDSDYWGGQITSNRVYEALVTVDPYDEPRFRFLPALAETWEISSDGRVYTFHLRKSVTWHDGHPFSAADVIATFDKVQDTTSKAASLRSYTQEIEKYEAIDASTIRFYLKQPYFLMMDGVFASVPIQPAHIIKKLTGAAYSESATNPINRAPIGTGPYRIEKWVNGQMIALRRNSDYWGKKPHIDRVVFRIVQEESVVLELAERGEVDVISRVRANQWIKLKQSRLREKFNRNLFYEANYRWIGWNQRRPQFQDPRVRRALTMLTDRPGIIDSLLHGLAKPTVCHFYWASTACDKTLQPLPYDPVQAVRLLEQAGWVDRDGDGIRDYQGHRFEFSFMVPTASEEAARIGTKMKEDFFRAGIDLKLQRVEWSAFVRRLRTHDFDACTLLWTGEPRQDPTQIWSSSSIDGGSNYISFSNPVADKLMHEARGELDDGRRDRLYQAFGRILYDEQPYTWLYVRPTMTLLSRRIKGVRQTLLGWVLEDWWLEDEASRSGGTR